MKTELELHVNSEQIKMPSKEKHSKVFRMQSR